MDSLPEENRGLLVARISPCPRPEIDSLPEENRRYCHGGTRGVVWGSFEGGFERLGEALRKLWGGFERLGEA